MAEITSSQHTMLSNFGPSSSYNISFNLSAISTYSSRFLAWIMHKEHNDLTAENLPTPWPSLLDNSDSAMSATTSAPAPTASVAIATATATTFPGPWAFFASGYMCGLVIMGILMHRIDNVFVPSPNRFQHPGQARRFGRLFNRFLPIDINRTSTRLAIHLPTIYLMCRVLLLWSLMLLQTSELLPWPLATQTDPGNLSLSSIVYRLGRWAASWETADVCWHTFGAICVAFCVEGLVKGLDGNGHGFGFGFAETNTSPFNLVGYAFLLHIYSSPLTHAYKPYKADFNSEHSNSERLPSRPDSHVLVTLTIPLLQLTLFHLLSVRKRWSRHRLLPTALASILSLTHFHITLIRYMITASSSTSSSNSVTNITNATTTPLPYTYTPHHTTHGYPLLNYIPNIFETMLLSTILLTIFLNTITQLLLTGCVNKPLLGLGININASEGWREMIPWNEDFGVVLLRIGTASFEASGKVGWGNEVGGVVASSPPDSTSSSAAARRYGSIRLTRSGVADVSRGHIQHTSQKGNNRIKKLKGWHNEVRDVDLGSSTTASTRRLWGINGIFTINRQWFAELKKFVRTAWSVVMGAIRVGWEVVKGKRKLFQRHRQSTPQVVPRLVDESQDDVDDGDDDSSFNDSEEEQLYQRFLRGESHFSDDEDEEYDISEDEEHEEVESDSELDGQELEAIHLYAELASNRESTPGASTASTMIAHMSYSGSSPLTRRRYEALQTQTGSSDFEGSSKHNVKRGNESGNCNEDDTRRNCVVCTTRAREIICWPCRCLSMCDFCRESLAARSSASKHKCPCCRRGVEGYSRIYIP